MGGRKVLGLVEPVTVHGDTQSEHLIARIDSGATASSIDTALAEKLQLGPVTREKIVKSASGVSRRPIIVAKITIDGEEMEEEFTLADRTHMTYKMLVGQNILKKGAFLIDPLKEVSE
ncbi:TPA: hypothetical protein HA278_04625 [Candidatus Woesearchaeota archaeon]|nr:hypothetical protein [Candidatus Woesearchaeota archaeon]